jgi:4'-phosphopantetheinyl transferase
MHDRVHHPGWDHTAGIPEGIVDVWRVDLREVGKGPLRLLSVDERKRAADIANPARRALWMRTRGVLRVLLGGYLKQPAGELEFVLGEHGKPMLAGPWERGVDESTADGASARSLHFNLSHSGPLALYAFTAAAQVGIDLEQARERQLDEPALAERTFGADAAQRLRELDAPARRQEFLRLWVRHEAALKCLGKGLLGAGPGNEADVSELWVAELNIGSAAAPSAEAAFGSGMAAAVAVQGGPRELRCWDWPPQAE